MEQKMMKQKLEQRIKDEDLMPNLGEPGEFIKSEAEQSYNYTKIKHLAPNNWIFHPQIVSKVLEGRYSEIMPYSGEFVTTLNCTNRCVFPCSFVEQRVIEGISKKNDFRNQRTHIQGLDFAKNLMDKVIDSGVKGIIFTGGGEPFLFKDLENLMSYAVKKGADTVLYTNGNATSEKRIKKVAEAGPLLVRVSLNAGTEEVYNKLHNPLSNQGAFYRALKTIEWLAESSLQNPKMNTGVGVVINEINKHDLVESAKRIKEIVKRTGGGVT